MVYCIPNAPKQNGALWVKVTRNKVKVMDPAGSYWRGRTFTLQEFMGILRAVDIKAV